VTTDLDIYRAANSLIEQHGEDAPIRAAMRLSPGTTVNMSLKKIVAKKSKGQGRSLSQS
jgi:hypothetical protein